MRLYKTSEYAIRALTLMAQKDRLFSARELHEELDIPYKYLTLLLQKLSKSGLISSVKGKNGGYRIDRPKDGVSLADIVEEVEGLENYDRCILGFPKCGDENPCAMHQFWGAHREALKEMLYSVTLKDLAESGTVIVKK